jgi:hypothetical protein
MVEETNERRKKEDPLERRIKEEFKRKEEALRRTKKKDSDWLVPMDDDTDEDDDDFGDSSVRVVNQRTHTIGSLIASINMCRMWATAHSLPRARRRASRSRPTCSPKAFTIVRRNSRRVCNHQRNWLSLGRAS